MQAQGGLLTEEGGQGIKREGDQHQQQQGVLPQAHAVHDGMTLSSHEIGLCQAMARGDTGVAPCEKMKQGSLAVHGT